MGVTLVAAARNAACDAIVDLIDAGSGSGNLVIMTSGDVEVATLGLSDPAFGDAAAGVATINAVSDDTSATGGTAALFKFEDSDQNEVLRGTVTATSGGGDIELDTVTVGVGETVEITTLTVTVPAS